MPRGEVEITRTPRDAETQLAIRTAAVPFATGKKLGSPEGGLAPSDELPLRAAGGHPIKIQGDDGTPDAYGNTDGVVTSSLQLSADGATLKFGGTGVILKYPLIFALEIKGFRRDILLGLSDFGSP